MWSINTTKNRTLKGGCIQSLDYHKEYLVAWIYLPKEYISVPSYSNCFVSVSCNLSSLGIVHCLIINISFARSVGCCLCLRGLAVIIHTFLHCGYVGHCPLSKEGLYLINMTCCELAVLPTWGQCLSLHCNDVTEMDLVWTQRIFTGISIFSNATTCSYELSWFPSWLWW